MLVLVLGGLFVTRKLKAQIKIRTFEPIKKRAESGECCQVNPTFDRPKNAGCTQLRQPIKSPTLFRPTVICQKNTNF
ncbi:hypothetical protein BST85_05165 [Aureitalea marina]|uniref:Uncharacterized protein n=1 Tax=Aureitalea marina TaxID=930804 RepID=A0A2S7KP00_9FLAO|nr:hypothetical protein BST85_05165 [Aureitalea marina]